MASLEALPSERAWALRERWLSGLGGKFEDKIEAHYELASAATQSNLVARRRSGLAPAAGVAAGGARGGARIGRRPRRS